MQPEKEKPHERDHTTDADDRACGVDLAKNLIQVHVDDATGRQVVAKAIKRKQVFVGWAGDSRSREGPRDTRKHCEDQQKKTDIPSTSNWRAEAQNDELPVAR